MNKKILVYGLLGLLSSGAAAGFVVANSQQGQALPASRDSQQPRSMRVDQHFIEMMIPHHRDAIAMADLALTRAKRPEVKRLAEAIKKDQAYEIQEMRTWYKQWYGKEVPAPSMAGMGMGQGMIGNPQNQGQGAGSGMMGMGQGMTGNPQNQGQGAGSGMMGMGQGMNMKTDLEALKKAPDFDKEFVRQMVPHHQMAVMMAQMASKRATRPEIRTLAQSIIKSQNAEIAQMQGWQQAWDR
jgi:uncharacterized protein (DUF305 family)